MDTTLTTEARIKKVMAQVLGLDAAAIDEQTSTATVKRWDSIGHMNLCAALEEEFAVAFDTDHVVGMTTYPAVVTTVEASLAS